MTEAIDRAYASTRLTASEAQAYERERECHRADCDSPVEDTKPCDRCADHFCCAHLYESLCVDCTEIDEKAEALNETIDMRRDGSVSLNSALSRLSAIREQRAEINFSVYGG